MAVRTASTAGHGGEHGHEASSPEPSKPETFQINGNGTGVRRAGMRCAGRSRAGSR